MNDTRDIENNIPNESVIEPEIVAENDVVMDTEDLDDSVIAEGNALESVKKLREKLKTSEEKASEYLTGWQRAKADLVNARKRDEEDRREFAKHAAESVIADLLPVLESFDMAMGNKEAWEKADKNWRIGVEYIYSQLKKALEGHGLIEIAPLGEVFDPARDEATEYVPVATETEDHKIIVVIQKGYLLNGKSIKAPKVKVGEFKKA